MVRKGRFLKEMEEFEIRTVDFMKKACTAQSTLNYGLHKGVHEYTSVHSKFKHRAQKL